MDLRVAITNSSNVALEMADIYGIESYLDKKKLVLNTRSDAQGDPELTMVTKSLISASVS
jgi:hypothetical protein